MAKKPPPPMDFSLQSTRVGFNIPKIKKVKSTGENGEFLWNNMCCDYMCLLLLNAGVLWT